MIQKIAIGRTAEVFNYGDGKVLKLFFENISNEAINIEYRNNKIIESLNIPSAKCFDIITYNNRKGLIIEKLDGLSMMKAMELNPLKSMSFAIPLAKAHYEIHKPLHEKLPNNKEQLYTRIDSVEMLSKNIKTKLYAYIESLNDDITLCHSDFHPENVFISNDKFIVFDWSTATIGNKFSDVAHTDLLLRYGVSPETKNPIELFITNKVRNSFADKYVNEYIKLSKCNKEDINQWKIPHMAAMLNDIFSKKTQLLFINQIDRFMNKKI